MEKKKLSKGRNETGARFGVAVGWEAYGVLWLHSNVKRSVQHINSPTKATRTPRPAAK